MILASVFVFSPRFQIVAQQMIAQGVAGAIVNVSSQASRRALRDHAVYCTYVWFSSTPHISD